MNDGTTAFSYQVWSRRSITRPKKSNSGCDRKNILQTGKNMYVKCDAQLLPSETYLRDFFLFTINNRATYETSQRVWKSQKAQVFH